MTAMLEALIHINAVSLETLSFVSWKNNLARAPLWQITDRKKPA